MKIGIDVGGTFTDGVIMDGNKILRSIKVPTLQDLTIPIREVLKKLSSGIDTTEIRRVVLSTTLITNILAQGKVEPIGLILLPGPGANPETLKIVGHKVAIKGAVDYRGRVIEKMDIAELEAAVESLVAKGITQLGVACKFSQRNPSLENEAITYIKGHFPKLRVMASHQIHGLLNWVRRANGAAYHLMVADEYISFIAQVKKTLKDCNIKSPAFVLKADGGTMPMEVSLHHPLEGIFSGPAASTLGALAAGGKNTTAIVMDMGGTTTDLALLLGGVPLLSEHGAVINGYPVPVRTLAVSSLAVGGDSSLVVKNGEISLGERKGCAFCLGGPCLTVTDLLVYLGLSDLGKPDLVVPELETLSDETGMQVKDIVHQTMDILMHELEEKLMSIFLLWEEEPAYRIWQVLAQQQERPNTLICLGGPAQGLGSLWGQKKGWEVIIPQHASVANAIGAALAKTTLRLDFFADTQQKIYSTNIGGLHGQINAALNNVNEAREFSQKLFRKKIDSWNLTDDRIEVIYEEGFNTIRGWHTVGKIYQVGLQTPPGLQEYLEKESGTNE